MRALMKSTVLLMFPGFVLGILAQACGGTGPAHAQAAETPDPIEGVWTAEVTIRDCTTGATVRSFRGLQMFEHGGQLTATNNAPTATQGPSLGGWQKGATAGQYTSTFRFFRYAVDGTFAGSQRVSRTIQLSGDKFTSTISAQVLDPGDQVVQTVCGTEVSSRSP